MIKAHSQQTVDLEQVILNKKNIQNELSLLETASSSHLEEEFFDYKNRYPKEI